MHTGLLLSIVLQGTHAEAFGRTYGFEHLATISFSCRSPAGHWKGQADISGGPSHEDEAHMG